MKWAEMEAMRISWDRIFEKKLKKYFKVQLKKILKLPDKDFIEKSFKIIDKDEAQLSTIMINLYTAIINKFGKLSYDELLSDKFKAFSIFEVGILAWVKRIIFPKSKGINRTTKNIIKKIVDSGIKNGQTVKEIKNEIKTKVPQINEARAKRIARTEVNSASNKGSFEGAKQTKLDLKKEWLATNDRRTRPAHRAANGQVVGLKAKFIVDGEFMEYPGDPSASYKNIVNCRCAITYYE